MTGWRRCTSPSPAPRGSPAAGRQSAAARNKCQRIAEAVRSVGQGSYFYSKTHARRMSVFTFCETKAREQPAEQHRFERVKETQLHVSRFYVGRN